jgi:cytokinesis protein
MRRKQAQTANPLSPTALSSDSDAPKSPASTGAMDDLLQKLRAAKPEARDQRDRRRRARLKDKHQVRVASGQKIPELGINTEEGEGGEDDAEAKEGSVTSPVSESVEGAATQTVSEVDIADRAAAMLEGLQGGGVNKDGSLSVRRRRESADTERQRRRNRRQQASSMRTDDGDVIMEETSAAGRGGEEDGDGDGGANERVNVIPPSPEGKGREGVEQ